MGLTHVTSATQLDAEPDFRLAASALDRLGRFVGETLSANALMFGQKSRAGAPASLRGIGRKPHVVVCENRKNERL